jgi:hypothetical protein
MDITLVTPFTSTSSKAIKISALYFDHVYLQQRNLLAWEPVDTSGANKDGSVGAIFRGELPMIDNKLSPLINTLEKENILTVLPDQSSVNWGDKTTQTTTSEIFPEPLEGNLRKFFFDNPNLFMEIRVEEIGPLQKISVRGADPSVIEVFQRFFGKLVPGQLYDLDPNFLATFYEGLLIDAINTVEKNKAVVTDSKAIINLFQHISRMDCFNLSLFKNNSNQLASSFAYDVMDTFLIDVSSLNIMDILEIRCTLRDELLAFRNEIERLNFEFVNEFGYDKIVNEGKKIAHYRLRPLIENLKNKIEDRNYTILKKLFEIAKSPGAYVPFIGSILAGLPIEIATLLSAGVLSSELSLEIWNKQKEVKRDNFLYLVKIEEVIKKQTHRNVKQPIPTNGIEQIQLKSGYFYAWPVELTVKKNS